MTSRKGKLFTAVCFLLVIVCALFVRLYGLSEYAFNDDEMWHLTVAAQENIWELLKYNFTEEIHPPLSYIIWHLMLRVSDNDLWLRMSSIIPGILLIPSIYLFGRLYIGKAAAVFLALLFAFGAVPVTISTTIRAYSLMMLALTWAAIFVHKYRFEIDRKSRNKFLLFYSICSFLAIELNHAACFVLFALGLILIFQTIKEKNKKDFLVIAVVHLSLATLVVGYAYVLKVYFGFNGNLGFYVVSEWFEYLECYLVMFLKFLTFNSEKGDVAGVIALLSFISFFGTLVSLFRAKKWLLLHLIFTPFLAVVLCDHFRFYPFSPTLRNNLFLFLGISILYAHFVQILANYCKAMLPKGFDEFSKRKNLPTISILLITILVTNYVYKQNFFRNLMPACVEFSIKKSDVNLLQGELEKRNISENVFVTVTRNIWYYRLHYGDSHITILTKNLAKFENDKITIYFLAFPAREFSTTGSMLEYQLFFQDLFQYLEERNTLSEVKTFTFFDVGLGVEYLATLFHPQMTIPAVKKFSDEDVYKKWREGYEMGWAINISKQVVDKFYYTDWRFSCGREILIFSFTPEFVREEILSRDFFDWRKFYNNKILKK
jgi:uncharacterized membrane protein